MGRLYWLNELSTETRFVLKPDEDVYVDLLAVIIRSLIYEINIRNNRIKILYERFPEIKSFHLEKDMA